MKHNSGKYYGAYDERYKTAHAHGVSWSSDVCTIVEKGITSALPDFNSLMYAVVKNTNFSKEKVYGNQKTDGI